MGNNSRKILLSLFVIVIVVFVVFIVNVDNPNKNMKNFTTGCATTGCATTGCATTECATWNSDVYDPNLSGTKPLKCCNGLNPQPDLNGAMRCTGDDCAQLNCDVYDPKYHGIKPIKCCDSSLIIKADSNGTMRCVNPIGKYKQTFYDNFTDLNKWSVSSDFDGKFTKSCAKYHQGGAYVDKTGLVLRVGPKTTIGCTGGGYTSDSCVKSGRVSSHFSQKYGIFLFNAKIPKGNYLWPALWLTGISPDSNHLWPQIGEIDIMETMHLGNNFSSRIMVPAGTDLSDWKAMSLPPDGTDADTQTVKEGFWDDYHIWALDWNKTDSDVTYNFYLDVHMTEYGLKNHDNSIPTPYKSYSLKNMIKSYGNGKMASYQQIDNAIQPQVMVMNVAVSSKGDNSHPQCDYTKCTGCADIGADMRVEHVEVWEKH